MTDSIKNGWREKSGDHKSPHDSASGDHKMNPSFLIFTWTNEGNLYYVSHLTTFSLSYSYAWKADMVEMPSYAVALIPSLDQSATHTYQHQLTLPQFSQLYTWMS